MSENQNRKPYTRETWPGYTWITCRYWDGTIFGSHDGVTWFPCYEGGEASAVPAERVPTPDDANNRSSAENAGLSDLRQRIGEDILAGLTEKIAVERMKATQAESVSAELLRVNAELKSELAAVKSQRDRLLALHDHKDQRISDIVAERDRLQSELADERRWQERLRELWDNTNGKCIPVLLTNRVAGGNTWDVIDRFEKTFKVLGRGPTPAAAVDAAANALGVTFEDEPVERDPERCGGRPVLKGTRVTMSQVLAQLADGDSVDSLAADMDLDADSIRQALRQMSSQLDEGDTYTSGNYADIIREQLANDPELAAEVEAARIEMENDSEDEDEPSAAPQVDKLANPLLCRASGETELPSAKICHTVSELRAFLIDEVFGDSMRDDEQLEADAAIEVIVDRDWHELGNWKVDFEIGGVSVEPVYEPVLNVHPPVEPRTDSSERDDTAPRFTLTPDGCGVLDSERPGMVAWFDDKDDASYFRGCFQSGCANPEFYHWEPYTPPEAAAPETGDVFIPELAGVRVVFWRCPNHPEGLVKWNATKTVATCQQCYRTNLADKAIEPEQPNQEHADGQQQVGGSGDERREDRSANVDDGQAECEPCVQRVADVVEQPTGNIPPAPHPGDVTQCECPTIDGVTVTGSSCPQHGLKQVDWDCSPPNGATPPLNEDSPPLKQQSPPFSEASPPPSDKPSLVIEVGGRYLCRDGVTTAEVICTARDPEYPFRVVFRGPKPDTGVVTAAGAFYVRGRHDYDLIRRLPDVVTVEVDPEIVAFLKSQGHRATRIGPTKNASESVLIMGPGSEPWRIIKRTESFAFVVEPIPAADTTALPASDDQKGGE